MKSSTESPDSGGNPGWAQALAGLPALLVYLATASGTSYWLDSAEFTAAAVELGIPHPPGHPLNQLWTSPFTLVPIGPLPFRVAVAQGVAGAIGIAALQVAFARTLRVLGLMPGLWRALCSVAASWLLAFSVGYWFQAVRAEVYALQGMLTCLALERALALATAAKLDVRKLYAACFYLGLGLANHHFMAVLAAPALAHGAYRALHRHRARALLGALACGALGLSSYVYLPLRALREPAIDLGHPTTLDSFWWVVSAQVYARRIGSEAAQPLSERLADLAVILAEQFTLPALPLALLGMYLVMRLPGLRAAGYVWASSALVSLLGRAWLNPVRGNPDVLGYMLPGFAGYLALALCTLALPLTGLAPHRQRRAGWLLCSALLAACGGQLWARHASASLRGFQATLSFGLAERAPLPPHAVVLRTSPEGTFRDWESHTVERFRPDLTMVPLLFLNYAETGARLAQRHPDLAPLIRTYQRSPEGALTLQDMAGLLAQRPVYIEGDVMVSSSLYPHMLPVGLLYRVLPSSATRAQVEAAAPARARALGGLQRALRDQLGLAETRRQLLWLYYIDALYYQRHQLPERARAAVRMGLALEPHTMQLRELAERLGEPAPAAPPER